MVGRQILQKLVVLLWNPPSGVEVSRSHRLLEAAWLTECGLWSPFSVDMCHIDQTSEGTCKFVGKMLHIYLKTEVA